MSEEPAPTGFLARVRAAWPPREWAGLTVLAAVSGGPDSVALLLALHTLRMAGPGRLVAAHYNHAARGAESDADEAFVLETCRRLAIPCEIGRPEPGRLEQPTDGFEAAARTARYEFLERAAARFGARYVATGHTADDQAETILHRILRGTGLAGLSGIPSVRQLNPVCALVRPLLSIRRSEVLAFLAESGQSYREDSSNAEPRFTRNRLRRELLPLLAAEYNPQVAEALQRLGSLAAEAQAIIGEQVAALAERAVACQTESATIDCRALAGTPAYLVRELLIAVWRRQGWPEQAMNHDKWQELSRLVEEGPSVTIVLPGAVRAQVQGSKLVLTRRA